MRLLFVVALVSCIAFFVSPKANAAAAAPIVFLAPSGGEAFVVGQAQIVMLDPKTRAKLVTIEISRDDGPFLFLGTINNADPNKALRYLLPFVVSGPGSVHCRFRATSGPSVGTTPEFSITTGEGVAPGAVTAAELADGSVTHSKLAPLAVTSDKVSSGAASPNMVLSADGFGNASWMPQSFTALTGTAGNAQLTNSSLTVTAGTGLIGGGLVPLGGTTTLSLGSDLTLAGTTTGTFSGDGTGLTNLSIANTLVNGSVTNVKLANPALTVAAGGGLTGGGTVALGSTTTLSLGTNLTLGGITTGSFSGPVAGTATNVTGIVALVNGGTGSAVQNFVDLNTTQTSIGGLKAFTGNVGIGTPTPAHRLSLIGGPFWTADQWVGAIEIDHAAALAWRANAAGQRFGMGHTNTGFFMFRTASNPGTTTSPVTYDFAINDAGSVGIGTISPTAGIRMEVNGAALFTPGNGAVQMGSPNGELGMSFIPTTGNVRADVRMDGTGLKLLAGSGQTPPAATNGLVITTAGNVGIGTAAPTPGIKLEVNGGMLVNGGGTGGKIQFGAPSGESGMTITGTNRADFRFDGTTLRLLAGTGQAPPAASNGIVIDATSGSVGIATDHASLFFTLDVNGSVQMRGNVVVGSTLFPPPVAKLFVTGDAAQSTDKGGFVKASAYIDPFLPAAQYVVRSFGPQGTAVTVTRSGVGFYTIDFGFSLVGRYISLTPQAFANSVNGNGSVALGSITGVSGSQVSVAFFRVSSGTVSEDCRFHIIVY